MELIGTTHHGYTVHAIPPGHESPMVGHRGGEVAVDDDARRMYAWGVFVACYGTDSIMRACNQYRA